MVKKTLLCLFVLTLACTMGFAASHPAIAHATQVIKGHMRQANPDHSVVLFNNLGASGFNYQLNGYFVAGSANSVLGEAQFIALPFTPTVAVTLGKVSAPIQYYGYGTNAVRFSLYSDNSGVPGTQIGNSVTKHNLPAFGTTGVTTTFNFSGQALALTAGTQYWIVGDEPNNSTAVEVWDADGQWLGYDVANAGWGAFQPNLAGAAKITGNN